MLFEKAIYLLCFSCRPFDTAHCFWNAKRHYLTFRIAHQPTKHKGKSKCAFYLPFFEYPNDLHVLLSCINQFSHSRPLFENKRFHPDYAPKNPKNKPDNLFDSAFLQCLSCLCDLFTCKTTWKFIQLFAEIHQNC